MTNLKFRDVFFDKKTFTKHIPIHILYLFFICICIYLENYPDIIYLVTNLFLLRAALFFMRMYFEESRKKHKEFFDELKKFNNP